MLLFCKDTKIDVPLGIANLLITGSDTCIICLGLMVQRSKDAAIILKEKHNIRASVLDLRSLVPLDLQSIKREVKKSGLVFIVEENPRLCGWGAEISSLIMEQCFSNLKESVVRISTPHIPIPSADILENNVIPSVNVIVENVLKNNYKCVGDYQNGKVKLFGFFVGEVMKETQGKANPKLVNQILKDKLKKEC